MTYLEHYAELLRRHGKAIEAVFHELGAARRGPSGEKLPPKRPSARQVDKMCAAINDLLFIAVELEDDPAYLRKEYPGVVRARS